MSKSHHCTKQHPCWIQGAPTKPLASYNNTTGAIDNTTNFREPRDNPVLVTGFITFIVLCVISVLVVLITYGGLQCTRRRNSPNVAASVENTPNILTLKTEERRMIIEHMFTGTTYSRHRNMSQGDGNNTAETDSMEVSSSVLAEDRSASTCSAAATMASEADRYQYLVTTMMETGFARAEDRQDSVERVLVHDSSIDSQIACAICLGDFKHDEVVMNGNLCTHIFHKSCILEWLEKNENCPCCRKEMFTRAQINEAAEEVFLDKTQSEPTQGGIGKKPPGAKGR